MYSFFVRLFVPLLPKPERAKTPCRWYREAWPGMRACYIVLMLHAVTPCQRIQHSATAGQGGQPWYPGISWHGNLQAFVAPLSGELSVDRLQWLKHYAHNDRVAWQSHLKHLASLIAFFLGLLSLGSNKKVQLYLRLCVIRPCATIERLQRFESHVCWSGLCSIKEMTAEPLCRSVLP